jgi:hypothetical protein
MITVHVENIEPTIEEISLIHPTIDKDQLRKALVDFTESLKAHLEARAALDTLFQLAASKVTIH